MNFAVSNWVGLLVTPVLIAVGQVLFKMTGMRIGESHDTGIIRILIDPYLLSALTVYGFGTLIWVYVLSRMPLSQAYPFMALTFVLVPIASVIIFREVLTSGYWLGAAFIVFGTIIISQSGR